MTGAEEILFPVGKLPHAELDRILAKAGRGDARVVVGPRTGEDAAVIDMGDRYLVSTTDPITFIEERIGWYCVHVNANDVATTGAVPRWFFAGLLLPEKRASRALVDSIFEDILRSCETLGITLCGGHTEITAGLDRSILVGQMMGEVGKDDLVRSEGMVPGDRILLTQGAAVEGTAILAAEKEKELMRVLNPDAIRRAKGFFTDPGISVVRAARIACDAGCVHAMHDPTEGGIATGLWEMAAAAGAGMRIREDAIPVFPETRAVCDCLGLDPLGLIASGALLVAADPEQADGIRLALEEEGIPVSWIGEVVKRGEGISIVRNGREMPMEPFSRDEIARVVSIQS